MTNPSYMHAVLLVDTSGSMDVMQEAAQSSINQFMKDQATGEGQITVSLYDFSAYNNMLRPFNSNSNLLSQDSNCYRRVFGPIDPKEAPKYVLVPSGGTALRDAMGAVIDETGVWLASLPEALRPGRVVFATITDGQENSSVRVSQEQLKTKITTQTEVWKWEFAFFGANIDAFDTGKSYGIANNTQYAGTDASYAGAYANFSTSLLTARASGASLQNTMAGKTNVDEEGNVS